MSERQAGPGNNKPGTPGPRQGLFGRNPFLIILLIVAFLVIVNSMLLAGNQLQISYSKFRDYVDRVPVAEQNAPATNPEGEADKEPPFKSLIISETRVRGKLLPIEDDPELPENYAQRIGSDGYLEFASERLAREDELLAELRKRGIDFQIMRDTDWAMWIWLLPLVFIILMVLMMFRTSRMQGENVMSFGRSRAKIVGEDKTGVTFKDVAGADEAKEELSEIVEFLKEPERFTSLGGKIPKGCLLMGAPGCGKTLLSRAVAGEAGVPFFSISGSDFVEMFVGVGAARVRDLFNTAKQKAPCIIFVDEIDAVGRHRGTGMGGGHDEREQTLNQLLVEMDGFDGRKGVIVIAATNRPDILDPALLRPGRFDRQVVLDAPDFRGREAVLGIHARGKPLDETVDLAMVAKRTPGFSGADLANVMNEAALLAARRKQTQISMKEVAEAVERVVAGPERRSRIIGPKEKRVLAYHELGHALVARYTESADKVHKVSIIPRGKGALGYTLTLPDEDRYIITKEELLARIRVYLGGRTAEEVVFDHKSTGAEDDLQKVTQLARSIVCRWGMTEDLGPVAYERAPGNPFVGRDQGQSETISDTTALEIDRKVRQLIETAHAEATDILTTNRDLLDKLADFLMEREVIDLEEFEEAVQKYASKPPPPLGIDLSSLRSPAERKPPEIPEATPAPEAEGGVEVIADDQPDASGQDDGNRPT